MKSHILILISLGALFSNSGCSNSYVSARTYPYTRKDLASYHMDTPDPLKVEMLPTQMIAIDWKLPSIPLSGADGSHSLHSIVAYLRFQDGSERAETLPVTSLYGKTKIALTQEEYRQKGGLSSYKILLLQGDQEIAESRHKLWEDKIVITE